MDKRDEIKSMIHGFNEYLHSIDLNVLKEQCTKEELFDFYSELAKINQRRIMNELHSLIGDVTFYHYPIIEEIEYLTIEEKEKLDTYLGSLRIGDSLKEMKTIFPSLTKSAKITALLTEKKVLKEEVAVICPNCKEGLVSNYVPNEQGDRIRNFFVRYKKETFEPRKRAMKKKLDEIICFCCNECDETPNIEKMRAIGFAFRHELIKEKVR